MSTEPVGRPEPSTAAEPAARLCLLVPTFNRAGFLSDLLERLADQIPLSAERIRVLVADNASEDDTGEVLDRMEQQVDWLRHHRQPRNLGPQANTRWLIEHAPPADYLWVLGDDDHPVSGALNRVLALLEAEQPAWLFLPHSWFDASGADVSASPVPAEVQRFTNAGEMFVAWHHWLTFISASIIRGPALRAAVRVTRSENAYHPLLWYFAASLDGPCIAANERLVRGSAEISWSDRRREYLTLHFTSLFDDGLCHGVSRAEFGASVDHLYANPELFELWRQVPVECLVDVVRRFPHSMTLRRFLWEIARRDGRQDLREVVAEAIEVTEAAGDAARLIEQGETCFQVGNILGAGQHFANAAALAPTCADAWNNLGVVAQARGESGARRMIENALFADPDHVDAIVNRAGLRLAEGDARGACADAQRALALDPASETAQEMRRIVGTEAAA